VLALRDLDGSRAGAPRALTLAASIVEVTGVELWYRGGLTTPGTVESARAAGASLLRVAVALDAEGARVPSPFADGADLSLPDAAGELAFRGVGGLVVTDVNRAGTLAGPNLTALRHLLDAVPCSVSYAGGVAAADDLRALRGLGRATLHAVLVATALSEGRLAAAEAVEILEQGA
jgi:phosphoribosylformimino-5-aminoimidazole carboxamide ribotide isomerase